MLETNIGQAGIRSKNFFFSVVFSESEDWNHYEYNHPHKHQKIYEIPFHLKFLILVVWSPHIENDKVYRG